MVKGSKAKEAHRAVLARGVDPESPALYFRCDSRNYDWRWITEEDKAVNEDVTTRTHLETAENSVALPSYLKLNSCY